jgi:PmbA protein
MTATIANAPGAAPHAAHARHFPVATAELERIAQAMLDAAKRGGATASETEVSQGIGQSVTVRKEAVETISYNRDKGISVTVFVGQRRGNASTADFSDDAIRATVEKALAIARYTAEDPAAGLADPARLAKSWPDLDLYHPWALSVEEAVELGRQTEAAALAVDTRITNSEGATVARSESEFVYANSLGFAGGYRTSRHHIDCSVIGEQDDACSAITGIRRRARRRISRRRRTWAALQANARFEGSARASCARSNAPSCSRPPKRRTSSASSCRPCRAEAFIANRHSCSTPSASRSSRRTCGLREEPHLLRARASAPFDSEGVATVPRDVVRDGIVQGYFLGSYSARKLGMESTGNGGGSHNLVLSHGEDDLPALIARMGRGLVVTEQLGQGVNPVTGDFSRGVAGFWVEDGVLAYPVEEITIAGNLRDMFKGIVAVGNDVDRRGSRHTGSILIDRMTVAGH